MLEFYVTNQKLKRTDRCDPATDSVEYLKAKFNFVTDDWNGKSKRAIFRLGEAKYEAVLNSDGICTVPHEVLVCTTEGYVQGRRSNKIFVTLVGVVDTVRITTNEERIDLAVSGYGEAETSNEPTPDVYAQYVTTILEDNDNTVAEIKADNDETVAEIVASNTEAVAETSANAERAEAAAEDAEESKAEIRNSYANAIKGFASGEIVRVDDVSPLEHSVNVKVHGKNWLNYEAFKSVVVMHGTGEFADNGVVTLTATEDDCYTNYTSVPTGARIPAKMGDTFTLSWETDATTDGAGLVYMFADGKAINYESECAKVGKLTYTAPYGCSFVVFRLGVAKAGTTVKYWNLQIEKGNTATEYVDYVDPSTITVTKNGKNLLKPRTNNGAGYTVVVNEDGTVSVTGAANTTNGIYLTIASPSEANPLKVKKGKAYRMQGWSNNGKSINVKLMDDNGNGFWTSANTWDKTIGTDYVNIVQIYLESTGHEVGDTSLCGTYRFQLEAGEETTAFEPYVELQTFTPNADGTVEGITSLEPTMTIATNTANTLVEVEYNKDLNVVINNLLEMILNGGT